MSRQIEQVLSNDFCATSLEAREHQNDSLSILKPLLEDFVHEAVTRKHLPLVKPGINTIFSMQNSKTVDKPFLVLAGVAHKTR